MGLSLAVSEWGERKLAFGAGLLNGWVDILTSLPRRARHSLVLGSDDTLPPRSGVSAMVLGFVAKADEVFLERELGDFGLLGAWGSLLTEGFLAH